MSIENELIQLGESKNLIKNAIIEKGGVVNDSTPLKDYAQAIRDLPSGGDRYAVIVEMDISNKIEQGINANIVIGGE